MKRKATNAAFVALVVIAACAVQVWRYSVWEEVTGVVIEEQGNGAERQLLEIPLPFCRYDFEVVARRSLIRLRLDNGDLRSVGCRTEEWKEYETGQRVTIKRRPKFWTLDYYWLSKGQG